MRPVDELRVRRALAALDAALADAPSPPRMPTLAELAYALSERNDTMKSTKVATRPTSVRLSAAQSDTLARLAPLVSVARPELAAGTAGGVLTPSAVMRLALHLGIEELERAVASAGLPE
jgi:hypothetical protein